MIEINFSSLQYLLRAVRESSKKEHLTQQHIMLSVAEYN